MTTAEFAFNPSEARDPHGKWAKVEAAEAGAQAAADATGAASRFRPGRAVAQIESAARDAATDIAEAGAKLAEGGKKTVRKAVKFLAAQVAAVTGELATIATVMGDAGLDQAVENRYGTKAATAISYAAKGTYHVAGGSQVPSNAVPGLYLIKKLPFIAVAEAVRFFRDLMHPPRKRSKSHEKRLARAIRKKGEEILTKRIKSELGKKYAKKQRTKLTNVPLPTFAAGPDWDAVAAVALHVAGERLDAWCEAHKGELARNLAPLAAADFAESWVTVEGRKGTTRVAIDGGKITKGPKDLKGKPAKTLSAKTGGKKQPAKGGGPKGGAKGPAPAGAVDPKREAKVAAASSSVLARGRAALNKAVRRLDRKTDLAGVKQLKGLFKGANRLVAKAVKRIKHRYGKAGAAVVLAGGALVGTNPLVTPPWLLALPGSTLVGAIPFLAVAEAVHQGRRAARKLEKKLGFSAGVTFEAAPDAVGERAAKALWREYLAWLKPRAAAVKKNLAALADLDLPPVVSRPGNKAAFALWEDSEARDRLGEFSGYCENVRLSAAALSQDLAAGRLPLDQWRGRMAALLAPVGFRAAVAVGPTDANWDLAESQARTAIAHVGLFADRLARFEEDWVREAPRRADLYAQVGFSALEEHRRLLARAAGFDEEKRECGEDCRECEECRAKAEMGWQPAGTLPACGDCPCATRCRCHFSFARAAA